jgi:hypothetical protein
VTVGDDAIRTSGLVQSVNADPASSTDDKHKDICSYDTIDALPHVDHYRNLFSITAPESKSRPTLEALHETAAGPGKFRLGSTIDLNSEMISTLVTVNDQPSQVDAKSKVNIVKFGWIVGVLVRSTNEVALSKWSHLLTLHRFAAC